MKAKAKKMGLRHLLESRLINCESEHVRTQLHHIFEKMDEPDESEARRRGKDHFIINEEDEEEDENGDGRVQTKQSEKKQSVKEQFEIDEGQDTMGDQEDEEDDMDDEGDEDDDEEEDEKMSISDFSIDDEYIQLQVK